jgi:hypothetical protein
LSEKLGLDFTTLGSPPVLGPNASVIPAVMPPRIALPPPEDLPASVSDLENGTPVSITKQIKKTWINLIHQLYVTYFIIADTGVWYGVHATRFQDHADLPDVFQGRDLCPSFWN